MSSTLRIATRGSDLALWQARFVASALRTEGVQTELLIIRTEGDVVQDRPLSTVDGTGFFTKDVENALHTNQADLAVHSYKDLPTAVDIEHNGESPLIIAAVPKRAPTADIMLFDRARSSQSMRFGLCTGARVGTSSRRRAAQLLSLRPDITIVELRGNVPTRLGRIHSDENNDPKAVDAVILAEAGLNRLELMPKANDPRTAFHRFSPDEMVPAASQGALALQANGENNAVCEILQRLHHGPTATAVHIERRLLAHFGGGCHLPLGVFAEPINDTEWKLLATVAAPDGSARMTSTAIGNENSIDAIINEVHAALLKQGAQRYLGGA